MNDKQISDHARDAASLRVLGIFFAILGGTVLVATLWELDSPRAAIVNAVSGIVLSSVAMGMLAISRRLAARYRASFAIPPTFSESK